MLYLTEFNSTLIISEIVCSYYRIDYQIMRYLWLRTYVSLSRHMYIARNPYTHECLHSDIAYHIWLVPMSDPCHNSHTLSFSQYSLLNNMEHWTHWTIFIVQSLHCYIVRLSPYPYAWSTSIHISIKWLNLCTFPN